VIVGNHEEYFFGPQGARARARDGVDPRLAAWLAEQPRARIRLLGVGVNHLHAADQMDLFSVSNAPGAGPATNPLDSAIDLIRERFGNFAVRRGSALPEARGMEEAREDPSGQAADRRRRGPGRSSPPTRFESR
jgi:hypothetical protein